MSTDADEGRISDKKRRRRDYYYVSDERRKTEGKANIKKYLENVNEVKKTKDIKSQIDVVGGCREVYEIVDKNLEKCLIDIKWMKETCDLYQWRKDYFNFNLPPLQSWFSNSSYINTITYQITKNFEQVVNICCSNLRPNDTHPWELYLEVEEDINWRGIIDIIVNNFQSLRKTGISLKSIVEKLVDEYGYLIPSVFISVSEKKMSMSKEKYIYFTKKSIFSNFLMRDFYETIYINNDKVKIKFHSVEQYMHACKAILFNDAESLEKILKCQDSMEAKNLGRLVDGFNEKLWNENAKKIVTRGCWLKFSQNNDLLTMLNNTGKGIFVECSKDKRWGIGLNFSQKHKKAWKGYNWLGQCLGNARMYIRNSSEPPPLFHSSLNIFHLLKNKNFNEIEITI